MTTTNRAPSRTVPPAATGIAGHAQTARRSRWPVVALGLGVVAVLVVAVAVLTGGKGNEPTPEATADPVLAAAPEPAVEPEVAAKPEPKVEPAVEPKVEPPRVEPKVEPKVEPVAAPVEPVVAPAPPRQLSVVLESTPAATVTQGGAALGKTPLTITWTDGEPAPKVKLESRGHRALDVALSAEDAATGTRAVTLERLRPATKPTATTTPVSRPTW